MTIEAVVFDWGGTLSTFVEVDLADMWRLAAARFDSERSEEVCRRLTEVEAATFARTVGDQRSSTLQQILETASADLGLDLTEAVFAEASEHYLDAWTPHIVHEKDAVEVLHGLKERGLSTGLLSNTHWPRPFHEHFLERDGLVDLLDVRLYTSELTHMKPHPSVFRSALAALGVEDPSRAVFVGDRLHDDVFGAQSVGMRGVWRRSPFVASHEVEPDAVIETLSDLPDLLNNWG